MTDRWLAQLPMIHIYGQDRWHEPAQIIGNRRGLEMLRDAIDGALRSGIEEAEVYATDGEGYGIAVVELCDSLMNEMPLPYTDPDAVPQQGPWPEIVRNHLNDWTKKRIAERGRK